MSSPVRVAVVDDYAVVVAGVASALAPHADRIRVVELDSRVPLESDVDILLYDSFGQVQADVVDVPDIANGRAAKVVAFSWNVDPALVQGALDRGVAGYIPKSVSAEDLVTALERIHAGEQVVPDVPAGEGGTFGAWPGREHGLTDREAEILALITQGLSNQEIAGRVYLGINTVKTHIRNAYRKIGVERRPQAVRWGIEHGFQPDTERHHLSS